MSLITQVKAASWWVVSDGRLNWLLWGASSIFPSAWSSLTTTLLLRSTQSRSLWASKSLRGHLVTWERGRSTWVSQWRHWTQPPTGWGRSSSCTWVSSKTNKLRESKSWNSSHSKSSSWEREYSLEERESEGRKSKTPSLQFLFKFWQKDCLNLIALKRLSDYHNPNRWTRVFLAKSNCRRISKPSNQWTWLISRDLNSQISGEAVFLSWKRIHPLNRAII